MEEKFMKLIVWGAGKEYVDHKKLLENMKYRLVDSDESRTGMVLDGVKIENPNIIEKSDYDYIVVASVRYFDEICYALIKNYGVADEKIIALHSLRKEMILRDIGKYPKGNRKGPKILFGYCFLTFENCRIHDFLLAESLRLRGADVIPVSCGGVQKMQCGVYGGLWGNNTHDQKKKEKNHNKNCQKCIGCDKRVWNDWGNYDVVLAKDFLSEEEQQFAWNYIDEQSISLIKKWMYDEFPIGMMTLRSYFNMELISKKEIWSEVEENEIRCLAYNVVIMCIASLKIVAHVKPDIIYSNDSFYYPYSILEMIAKRENIPFYNAYGGFRKNTYSYAMNRECCGMYFDDAWKSFSKRELNKEEEDFIRDYVKRRKYGKDMLINTANPFESVIIRNDSIHGKIVEKKKTALLATNVTWDAACLGKGVAFENIEEWVLHTIVFFAQNSEWQLIIKIHPAEVSKILPEARERICQVVLEKYDGMLPDNIVIIDADAPVSVYELLEFVNLGIVYTTTVGLEMSCNRIPVITVADAPYRNKGFTWDPVNVKEYEEQLKWFMSNTLDDKVLTKIERQAQKYFLLYYFIYMLPCPFHTYTYEEGGRLLIKGAEELLPGENDILDYICDSILEKKPFLSEKRLPPYRLELLWT